ncbi:MAG: hypothetical protein K5846_01370 [Bacteroidales bacterium]|nr:hypothetical protein [Bacteroidales bacterium]
MKKIDKIFAKGVRNLSHAPNQPMSEEKIAAAAAATSQSGAGIWLSHVTEILLCITSLAVGVGATLLTTHLIQPKKPATQPIVEAVSVDLCDSTDYDISHDFDIDNTANDKSKIENRKSQISSNQPPITLSQKTTANHQQPISNPQTPKANGQALAPTPSVQSPNSKTQLPTPEPAIIKKTIIQRDTVKINQTIIIKDTVYVP